jgi:hypothetical protein
MNREAWKEAVRRLPTEEFQTLQEVVWEEHRAREAQQLAGLRTGDWVEFQDKYGQSLRGVVTRMNRRTVSVEVDSRPGDGVSRHWRVGVSLVRRVLPGEAPLEGLPPGKTKVADGLDKTFESEEGAPE